MLFIVVLAVVSAFLFFNDSSVNLAPRTYKPGLPDLTTSASIINVLNNSVNGSIQYLINYTIDYRNIGNVVASNITAESGFSMTCTSGGGYGSGGQYIIPSLNPGQVIVSSFSSAINCQGLWVGSSIVDPYNNIAELNENNNNATASVTI